MLFKNYDTLVANGQTPELQKKRRDVLEILTAAVESVNPYNAVKRIFHNEHIVLKDKKIDFSRFKHIYLVGFGKASVGMAQAICDTVSISRGVVVTNDSSAKLSHENIEVIIGGHPIPDKNSIVGADKILEIVNLSGKDDCVIVLVSGGGSALLCKPRISLSDLQATTDLLLRSGANINEINTVRKHISLVKGGHLIKQGKGTVITLIISDIIGNPLEFIASGPTYPDSTTFSDAKNVLEKYDLYNKIPKVVRHILEQGIAGKIEETPKRDNPIFNNAFHYIIANNEIACKAAEQKATEMGYKTIILTTSLAGESREIGRYLIEKAKNFYKKEGEVVFISGGETTVTIKGKGKGGRNQELALGAVDSISGSSLVLASFGTDGIDGQSDAAGAIIDGCTFLRAKQKNLDYKIFLQQNNSFGFFKVLDDAFITGPTGTNVMDMQVIIV